VIAAAAGIMGTALAAGSTASGTATRPTAGRDLAPHRSIQPPRASRSVRRTALAGSPRTVAHALLLRRGWSEAQWSCLDALWSRESHWRVGATNPRSGAYGIPQALPATKMAAMGSDWRTNALTQIRWGLWYIGKSYGTPCNALAHSNSRGFY
jgi:hypothetical protein